MRDETRSALERLAPGADSRARAWFDEVEDPDGHLSDLVDDAWFEAAQRLDPSVSRAGNLLVAFRGDLVGSGEIRADIAQEVLGPLGKEISAAAGPRSADAQLSLTGVSAGSAVLHFRPKRPTVDPDSDNLNVSVSSAADQAVRRIIQLHGLIEQGAEAATITSSVRDRSQVLRHVRGLLTALDKYELTMSARWWSPILSQRVSSQLTEAGRRHGRAIFKMIDQPVQEQLSGLVAALDVDGEVAIATAAKRRQRVRVDPELIAAGRFALGTTVHILVERHQTVDEVGIKGGSKVVDFVDFMSRQSTLDS